MTELRLPERILLARRVLAANGGVAPLREFVGAGLTGWQMGDLLHRAVVVRPRVGLYVDPLLPEAAVRALRVGGVLGCCSAAAAWGIVTPEHADDTLHVSIPPGSTRLRFADDATRRARAGVDRAVRWHWEARARPVEAWRVSIVDTLLQLASCVEFRWLVAAIDSARCRARREPLLGDTDCARLRELLPERLRSAVDLSDPRSETSGETLVRLECLSRGIPFVPQQWWTSGFRPDATVDGWLPIEVDGMETHSGREAGERDRERDGVIARFGPHPLRFSQTKAVRETAWVGDTIEAVWRRGCPPGFRRLNPPAA